ncbi:HlyD family secretion protein [Legionella spiritensis]|uniref:Hemolysin D n=1 Tax=Legionella spiritensis TaxID=452 RepID=A0A0W0YXU2_LEGSP|nr:HlyD family efflux transporter periplasmic adaptor subunit [Legionella spiritensis]KTD61697.1 hemolysin D [Legionella spiritensis]SNV38889.1 hemolysin D [Legionella spiritensis]
MDSLFRKEVIESRSNQAYGSVFINEPPKYKTILIGYAALIVMIVVFFMFAEFTEKFIVSGFLNSSRPSVQVYPRINGIITNSYHHQGDRVKKGEPLFLINTSYTEFKSDMREIALQLQNRKAAIEEEIVYKKKLAHSLEPLLQKKYVAITEYNRIKEDIAELENRRNLVEIDRIKNEQSKSYVLKSPIDGVISNVLYREGQYINTAKPLAKIIPAESKLVAEIFVPARQAGFLRKDSPVIIRYDAYPYERFGTYRAVIEDISQSAMTDEEEEKPIKIGEPYYKVTARLKKQSVMLYGKRETMKHGMTLSAVIVGSKRKVWQWVLDPVYSYYGVLFK